MIYLDYAANTPVDDEVLRVFDDVTKNYTANPNSTHPLGELAKKQIDDASLKLAQHFNCEPSGVIYTSGSSESNNMVIKGVADKRKELGNKIIISSVEHSSIIAPCNFLAERGFDVVMIPTNKDGVIDLEEFKKEIDDNTILVSIAAVDSELGTIEPIEEVANIVKNYPNCVFHTDATQAIGKLDINYENIDFITFAPHKFFGLNGFGALINRNNIKITPLIHGGKSTTIYRSGTPVTANVVSLYKAFEIAMDKKDERYNHAKALNDYIRSELSKLDYVHINSSQSTIPNTLNISLIGKDTKRVVKELADNDIYVSTSTACSLEDMPSKTVLAITGDEDLARNTIRISLSHLTSLDDIKTFINKFIELTK